MYRPGRTGTECFSENIARKGTATQIDTHLFNGEIALEASRAIDGINHGGLEDCNVNFQVES